MIHRQRNLITELLHHDIDIHPQLYLTFVLSMSLLLLSLSYSYSGKELGSTGQVQGIQTPDISIMQTHLSTVPAESDSSAYNITYKVTVLNNNPYSLSKVYLQNSLTHGWQNELLQPKVLDVKVSNPLTQNNHFDGYATSVMNNVDDNFEEYDEGSAIIEVRVKQPPYDVTIENNVIFRARNEDDRIIIQQSALSLLIPGKFIQPN